jgi:hypothetical protein
VDLLHTVIQDPFAIILEIPQIYLRSLHFWSRWHCGVERRETETKSSSQPSKRVRSRTRADVQAKIEKGTSDRALIARYWCSRLTPSVKQIIHRAACTLGTSPRGKAQYMTMITWKTVMRAWKSSFRLGSVTGWLLTTRSVFSPTARIREGESKKSRTRSCSIKGAICEKRCFKTEITPADQDDGNIAELPDIGVSPARLALRSASH